MKDEENDTSTERTISLLMSILRYSTNATSGYRHSLGIECLLMACMSSSTIFGNLLVIAASVHSYRLRSSSNFLICSLASADLLLGLFVMPFHIVHKAHGSWPLGLAVCDFWHCLDVLASTASIWNLCVISLDRYLAVRDPLTYRSIMSATRAQCAICCVWLLSSLLAFPAVAWWRLDVPADYTDPQKCRFTGSYSFLVTSSLLSFYMPLLIMVFAYCKVYTAAASYEKSLRLGSKQMPRKGQKMIHMRVHRGKATVSNSSSTNRRLICRDQSLETSDNSAPEPLLSMKESVSTGMINKKINLFPEDSDNSSNTMPDCKNSVVSITGITKSPTTRIRRSISTGNGRKSQKVTRQFNNLQTRMNRFSREKKAAKTLGIVMGCFVCCWCPFFIFNIVDSALPQVFVGKSVVFEVTTWLGYCNSFLNPVIYAWHSLEYRMAFKTLLRKLCCCKPGSSSQYNSYSSTNKTTRLILNVNTSVYGSILTSRRADEDHDHNSSHKTQNTNQIPHNCSPPTPELL